MAHGGAGALAALEARAIREKNLTTYSTALGSTALSLFVVLGFALPSPWKVINGEWSSSILPSLLALAGSSVYQVIHLRRRLHAG